MGVAGDLRKPAGAVGVPVVGGEDRKPILKTTAGAREQGNRVKEGVLSGF